METVVEKLDTCNIKIKVTCSPEIVKKGYNKAYRVLFKRLRPAGFRKDAPVPKQLVKQLVGQSQLDEYARDEIVNLAYGDVIKKENINPYQSGRILEADVNELDAKCTFSAKIPLDPVIEICDYQIKEKSDKAEAQDAEVTDKELEDSLLSLQNRLAKSNTFENKPLEENHVAKVNFRVNTTKVHDKELTVKIGESFKELDNALLSMKSGDSKEIELSYPSWFPVSEWRLKTLPTSITVNETIEKQLPELNDDFAKSLKEDPMYQTLACDTLDELKANIKNEIGQAKQKSMDTQNAEKSLINILEKSEISIPDALWEEVVERRLQDVAREQRNRGVSIEQFLKDQNLTAEQFQETTKEEAIYEVKKAIVIKEIANKENIELNNGDLQIAMYDIAREYNVNPYTIMQNMKNKETYSEVYYRAMYNKVLAFLTNKEIIN